MTLGRLAEVGPRRSVVLDLSKEHVVAIVGKRGSGKTHTLGVLAEGLVSQVEENVAIGEGERDHAVVVIDTLNLFQWVDIPLDEARGAAADEQRTLLQRWGLPAVSISPQFWHVAGSDPITQTSKPLSIRPSDMESQDWGMLLGVDTVTEPMGQLLVAARDKVSRTGWGSGETRVAANPAHSIPHLVACIKRDSELGAEFAPETRRAVAQRLTSFERTGLFSAEGTGIGELLAPGHMSVLLLRGVSDDMRAAIAFLVIRKLLEERSAASEAAKHAIVTGGDVPVEALPKAWVLIDEAQNIIPSKGASMANEILTRFVREGRNFGLSMVISTQQPSAIDSRVMAQVDILMAHTLTVRQDVAHVTANLKSSEPKSISLTARNVDMGDALRLLDVGQCLVSATESERTFFLSVRPRVTLHGGFEA